MGHRGLRSIGALAVAVACAAPAAVIAGQQSKPAPAKPTSQNGEAADLLKKARAEAAAGKTYKAPRTAWGEPDLQGVWSYATTTPLSRPESVSPDKRQLTEDEIEALAEQQAAQQDAAPRAGDPGTYNNFWWDRGASIGRTSLIVDPPDGKLPPLTPEGQKRRAARIAQERDHPADSYLDRSPTDRCIMYHGVPPLSSGYNNTYQIFQSPGLVAILDENIHHVRMIPLDGRPHIPDSVRQWNGDSRGYWEGDVLVVETKNFNEKTRLRYGGSENTVAVERFKRVGPDVIDYQYTITDPASYTRPFTVALPLPRRDDKVFEYACHEGNHALAGILSGARAEERRAKEPATTRQR
jgi:hypothetical protein